MVRMESSSSSLSSSRMRRPGHRQSTRDKFLSRVLLPAIRGQSCPICFKDLGDNNNHRRSAVIAVCLHAYCLDCITRWSNLKRTCPLCNARFNSWHCNISLSRRNFLTRELPPLNELKPVISNSHQLSRRSRIRLTIGGRRDRQLPWRRNFGSMPSHIIAERKLQWRSSIYKQSLRAVPLTPGNLMEQNVLRDGSSKETILHRIGPWIRRELQAILEDPDPSVIVHVASSIYISRQLGDENDFLAPLRRFLHSWTDMFWHELRCFAESGLTIDTYDAVVEYIQSD